MNYIGYSPSTEIRNLITQSQQFIESIMKQSHGLRLSDVSLHYDMVVDIYFKSLDANVLANAYPTIVNTDKVPSIPLRQTVTINTNRLADLVSQVQLNNKPVAKIIPVLIHEILHGLGIASLQTNFITVGWDQFLDSTKTWYSHNDWTKSEAIKAYREIAGTNVYRIPVENSFGQGTAYSHWEEGLQDGFLKEPRYYNYGSGNVFHPALPEEIMTGIAGNKFYFTKLTAGALVDHGYDVDMNHSNIVPYPASLIQTP